jgi:hypothetical protein
VTSQLIPLSNNLFPRNWPSFLAYQPVVTPLGGGDFALSAHGKSLLTLRRKYACFTSTLEEATLSEGVSLKKRQAKTEG